MVIVRVFLALVLLNIISFYANAWADIRIATYLEPPFAYVDEGELVGENIDIAKLLANAAGYSPVFIQCPIARCLSMIKQGQADMIIALRKTKARQEFMSFLNPPYYIQHDPIKFYTLATANININNFEDLELLTVGTLRGTRYFDQFDQDDTLNKVEVSTIGQLINLLKKDRIDTFLEREESVLAWIDKSEYQKLFQLAEYEYDNAVGVYIGISKKSLHHNDINNLSKQLSLLVSQGIIQNILDGNNPQQP